MIWLVFALMVAVALGFLLWPLLRPTGAVASARIEYDLTVYKDQLAEIGRDVERGLLTPDQAEAARTEVSRRMLTAADGEKGQSKATSSRGRGAALAIALALPLVAFGFYVFLGAPHLPDQPYSARSGQLAKAQGQAAQIQAMVAQLSERLEKTPGDGKGWAMLGRSWRVLGDSEKAAAAFKKAVALLPDEVQPRLEYAALLLDQTDTLTPEIVVLMREILALDANQADALYFMGMAELQIGNKAKAREMWTRLLQQIPADSPERGEIIKMMEQAK
jgi:cytochrome c-type biogenesis protein CcmH